MSRLFISLYLDEDVSSVLGALMRSRGFSAQTAHEAGNLGKSDTQQLAFAAEHQMAIMSHNRSDFEALAEDWRIAGQSHAGIIIVVRRKPYEIAGRLLALLNGVTADEMDNQVMYI